MNKNKVLVTTAIDYVNDVIHIGHVYQKVIADVLARYYRATYGKENVYFLTGTDENGAKAQEAAKEFGKEVKQFVDEISKADKKEQDSLTISYDRFIRTTDKDHVKTVVDFWNRVKKTGDIYIGDFKGKYCAGCESFKTASELEDGLCSIHPKQKIEIVTEKNYFFKWGKYVSFLRSLIQQTSEFVLPKTRRNEMLSFVDKIEDITISRRKEAVPWGIEVPGDKSQIIYVWFDALINYLTGASPKGFWDKDTKIVHILGKDNLRWHALLWPAMLKSAGFELPNTIYAHGFLTLNGKKISKSLGNIIRPSELVREFGADPIRYYFLRYTSTEDDNDISIDKIKNAYNSDLANGLGNLVSRVAKLASTADVKVKKPGRTTIDPKVGRLIEAWQFNEALAYIWSKITDADMLIEKEKPWELIKKDDRRAKAVLTDLIQQIRKLAVYLEPFLPETSAKIQKQFSGPKVKSAKPLFPRI